MVLELVAVLLVTALAFAWGKQTAQAERGYTVVGGEYLLLLLPFMYYPGKRTIRDWATEIREVWREGRVRERRQCSELTISE